MCVRRRRAARGQRFLRRKRAGAERRMARQRLGQHFLADAGWREEIAQAIRVSQQSISPIPRGEAADFCWVEIGAGHGEMTEHLASTGALVYAIELDAPPAAALQRFAKRYPNVTVVAADVLETD